MAVYDLIQDVIVIVLVIILQPILQEEIGGFDILVEKKYLSFFIF